MENLDFLKILEDRFNKNMHRHSTLTWDEVVKNLDDKKIKILEKMEETGGEPDVIIFNGDMLFVDFAKESPKERKNTCYDEEARINRKKFPPELSVEMMLNEIGSSLVTEEIYRFMQSLDDIDLKTSSWLKTNLKVRSLGGAIFGDKRYKETFIYHNGADSYYSSRGFRSFIKID